MLNGKTTGRISDLHKGAFWIYGVTAMVMREPFAAVIRHTSTAGPADWQVRLELLRLAVVLLLMSRLFLASGLYFDEVYMRPNSAESFPHRSYAVDFLAGLIQFLVVVAASTAVSLHSRAFGEFSPFMILVAAFLLSETGWLSLSILLGFSSRKRIARFARLNSAALAMSAVVWGGVRVAGADPVLADQVALALIAVLTMYDAARLIHEYDRSSNV